VTTIAFTTSYCIAWQLWQKYYDRSIFATTVVLCTS